MRNSAVLRVLFVALWFQIVTISLRADPLDEWVWRNPAPMGNDPFPALTYGNGKFVALNGLVAVTSSDGVNWNFRNNFPSSDCQGCNNNIRVGYGNGMFVAVGGIGNIITSSDGINWSKQDSGTLAGLVAVTYGNGRFVVVGSAIILTSTDGISWDAVQPPENTRYSGVTYGQGKFVAVAGGEPGSSGVRSAAIATSTDGIVWTKRQSGTRAGIQSIAYGGGLFVAAGWSGAVLTSGDGINWVESAATRYDISSIIYANGIFVATAYGSIITTKDGTNWNAYNVSTVPLGAITYGDGTFVVLGGSSLGLLMTSKDVITWTNHSSLVTPNTLNAAAYGNGTFVAAGRGGTIVSSTNGITWTTQFSRTLNDLLGGTFGDGKFILCGDVGTILISTNGVDWARRPSGVTTPLFGVAYGAGMFVAVGPLLGAQVLTSNDAVTWTNHSTSRVGSPPRLSGITYGQGVFVAVGGYGGDDGTDNILTSTNGVDWTFRVSSPDRYNGVHTVAYGNGMFVATKHSSSVLTSSDGITWKDHDLGISFAERFTAITFGDGNFVVTGISRDIINNNSGSRWTSSDGNTWKERKETSIGQPLYGVTYGDGTFVAVGNNGTILQTSGSAPAPKPASPTITSSPRGQFVTPNGNVTFNVVANGTAPLIFQWEFNGASIPGAVSPTFTLSNVSADQAGIYSVVVANAVGTATSEPARLTVLTDLGKLSPSTPSSFSSLPPKQSGKDSLIIVTHGWQPQGVAASQVVGPGFAFSDEQNKLIDKLVDVSWVDDMVKIIDQSLVTKGVGNWQSFAYKWKTGASTPFPDDALRNAANEGGKLGKDIVNQGWSHVHLIAHSAGAGLIQAAAEVIKSSGATTVVHTTFLDAYVGLDEAWRSRYGKASDWSDSYFSDDISDRLLKAPLTGGGFPWAYNVNVTWLDKAKAVTAFYCSSPSSTPATLAPCGYQALSSHPWPHDYYQATIGLNDSQGYGFPLSKEGGGWNNRGNYSKGKEPLVLGGEQSLSQTILPVRTDAKLNFSLIPNGKSGSGTVQLFDDHFNLFTGAAIGLQSVGKSGVGAPVWLSLGITVTNVISFVTFDAQFTSAASAAGLLSVYWNTNRIGSVDEAALLPGQQNYTLALPGTFSNGDYVLGFRLDSFTNITSSVSVTNVAFGYTGLTNPITLNITRAVTNPSPTLTLTGARGYNYLVQSSTNLMDWAPLAILVNTNSTIQFIDSGATNETRRFYRAVLP